MHIRSATALRNHKIALAAILDAQKSLLIIFSPFQINIQLFIYAVPSDCGALQNGRRRPFWITENHFRSHLSPFQINTPL